MAIRCKRTTLLAVDGDLWQRPGQMPPGPSKRRSR